MCLLRLVPLFFVLFFGLSQPIFANAEYVGSEKCSECHEDIYSNWHATGHHQQLRKAEKAEHANLPLPQGYTWDDISYVIGGISKKTHYVDQQGYLITSAKDGSKTKTQYNLKEDTWVDFFPGEKKLYGCANCHTTGYDSDGHQDGLPGIVGTWKEDGIGCEACHGPGSNHINDPRKRSIQRDRATEKCENCHQRGGIDNKPLAGFGLIRHHEQLDELKAGAHKGLSCLNCHNPHKRSTEAKRNCTICHSRIYSALKKDPHGKSGIKCIECHMPKVSNPAISRVSYIGEMRTHLFKINTDAKAEMFKVIEDQNKKSIFTKGFVTVDFVCLACHGSRDKAWAAQNAKGFHR